MSTVPAPRRRRRPRRWRSPARRPTVLAVAAATALGALLVTGTVTWTRARSAHHIFAVERAPAAPVAVVFGTGLPAGSTQPQPFLAGRLDTAVRLVAAGRARTVLVSGDDSDGSGNEVTVMRAYLTRHGVDPGRIVADPHGLDTYDTCVRAAQTFGVRRALLVTQAYHLPRAVTLCRGVGIDAHGVPARCAGCNDLVLAARAVRDMIATTKAASDMIRRPPPAVLSPPWAHGH